MDARASFRERTATNRKLLGLILRERSLAHRLAITAAVVAGSVIVTYSLDRAYPEGHLYSVNLASSIIAAAFGGLVPGLLASLAEALVVDYFFVEPRGFILDSFPSVLRVVLYVSFGWLTCYLVAHLREALRSSNSERDLSLELARSRETMLALVSHDLRGPLSAIAMAAKMLSRLVPEQEKATKYSQYVTNAVDQMSFLIDDLLDASRIEQGTFTLKPEASDLGRLIDQAIRSVEKDAAKKDVTLVRRTGAEDEPPRVFDFHRLLQLLTNLLSNAIKFSPASGTVTLEVRCEGELVTFRVRDEGPGIRPGDREKVFTKFYQGDHHKHPGTGLGLFISKGIVSAHGGSIRIEDSDSGAVFSLELRLRPVSPLEQEEAAHAFQ